MPAVFSLFKSNSGSFPSFVQYVCADMNTVTTPRAFRGGGLGANELLEVCLWCECDPTLIQAMYMLYV